MRKHTIQLGSAALAAALMAGSAAAQPTDKPAKSPAGASAPQPTDKPEKGPSGPPAHPSATPGPASFKEAALSPEFIDSLRKQIRVQGESTASEFKRVYKSQRNFREETEKQYEKLAKRQADERLEFEEKALKAKLAILDGLKGKTRNDWDKANMEYQAEWGKKRAEFAEASQKETGEAMERIEALRKESDAKLQQENEEAAKKYGPALSRPGPDPINGQAPSATSSGVNSGPAPQTPPNTSK